VEGKRATIDQKKLMIPDLTDNITLTPSSHTPKHMLSSVSDYSSLSLPLPWQTAFLSFLCRGALSTMPPLRAAFFALHPSARHIASCHLDAMM
jgi:hypothetical protein